MVSLTVDTAASEIAPPAPGRDGGGGTSWSLLDRLEHTTIGIRQPDGTTAIRRAEPAGSILYGPYWHLPTGRYRLVFRCRAGAVRLADQPVLGVEIIVLSRFQRAWRDFTAAELQHRPGTLTFDVPPELSADGGNEGRFEFRFFHLGNADLAIEAVELEQLPDDTEAVSDPRHWRLLGRLRETWLGRRNASGAITVKGGRRAGCMLYGGWPYLRLGRGRYRLSIGGRSGPARLPSQPVLGVEILGRSRWYSDALLYGLVRAPKAGGIREAWGDFLVSEWAGGAVSLEFTVPTPLALEAGADAPFDIRLLHLGNADLTIDAVDLTWLGDDEAAPAPSTWRLLGRLHKARIGVATAAGVSVAANEVPGRWLSRPQPPLFLSEGHYRLTLRGRGEPALEAKITEFPAASHWWAPWPALPIRQLRHEFAAVDLAAGAATAEFDVPPPAEGEVGDRRYALTIAHLGTADLALTAVDLQRDAPVTDTARPATHLAGRKKLVFIGNCQCSVLCQAFNQTDGLSRNFVTKYHFVQLRPNLYEFARRDIEDCDVLLIQDIDLWNQFPLRDCVRPGTEIVKFPLVRFASLWPFDAWNGPGDREAHDREAPNSTFPFLDGLLARLRREIPDKEERFRAYRALDGAGVVNYRRIHALEERRLLKVDKEYDCSIGEFTLENFRTRQVFHTTVRPNWQGFNLLIRMLLKSIGVIAADPLAQSADALLRIPQVPVHPRVAQDLGVKWADEKTRYLTFGREMNWETYIRRYIDHYG